MKASILLHRYVIPMQFILNNIEIHVHELWFRDLSNDMSFVIISSSYAASEVLFDINRMFLNCTSTYMIYSYLIYAMFEGVNTSISTYQSFLQVSVPLEKQKTRNKKKIDQNSEWKVVLSTSSRRRCNLIQLYAHARLYDAIAVFNHFKSTLNHC